jgi:hypothetical protein
MPVRRAAIYIKQLFFQKNWIIFSSSQPVYNFSFGRIFFRFRRHFVSDRPSRAQPHAERMAYLREPSDQAILLAGRGPEDLADDARDLRVRRRVRCIRLRERLGRNVGGQTLR